MCPIQQRPKDWLNNLIDALKHISATHSFTSITAEASPEFRIQPNQIGRISDSIVDLKHMVTSNDTHNFFVKQVEIPILDKDLSDHFPTFIIGGKIRGNKREIEYYSFSVCITFTSPQPSGSPTGQRPNGSMIDAPSCCIDKHPEMKRIVRRIHFDYQPNDHTPDLKWHLQLGGEFPKNHDCGELHYCLDSFLEKPRIPILSQDYVLALNLMLNQFETPLGGIRDGRWNSIVDTSRSLLLS